MHEPFMFNRAADTQTSTALHGAHKTWTSLDFQIMLMIPYIYSCMQELVLHLAIEAVKIKYNCFDGF